MQRSSNLFWFGSRGDYLAYEESLTGSLGEEIAATATTHIEAHCVACRRRSAFMVSTGAMFDGRPNLREGLRCEGCRMSARQRGLASALMDTFADGKDLRGLLMECWSPLRRFIGKHHPGTVVSEFLPGRRQPGRRYIWWPGRRAWRASIVRHESITDLSFESSSLDFVIHSDVLEHVEDYAAALRECRRVLKPGAPMLMTAPFFSALDRSLVRGRTDGSGRRVDLLPPEFHGDGLHKEGIYTFHNFGWDLFETMKTIFAGVEIGARHSAEDGFLYADSVPGAFNMLPLVFRAYR